MLARYYWKTIITVQKQEYQKDKEAYNVIRKLAENIETLKQY